MPTTATYSFTGNVKGLDTNQGTDTFRIYVSGIQVGGNSNNSSINTVTPISFSSAPLPAGTVVDFIVTGPATYATYGINGVITSNPFSAVPEPSAWLSLGGGFKALAAFRFRRRSI